MEATYPPEIVGAQRWLQYPANAARLRRRWMKSMTAPCCTGKASGE